MACTPEVRRASAQRIQKALEVATAARSRENLESSLSEVALLCACFCLLVCLSVCLHVCFNDCLNVCLNVC